MPALTGLLLGAFALLQDPHPYVARGGAPVPGQPYHAFTVRDSLGREVTFYLSERSGGGTAPLIAFVHGSGAGALFTANPEGRLSPHAGHATLTDVAGRRARILIVEKPGVVPGSPGAELPEAFRVEHTLERWAEAVAAAFLAARRLPGIDTARALMVGHSEGGIVAARVAARLPALSHVALLAAGGPTQLFDLLLLARRGVFFGRVAADPAAREAYVLAQWDSIRAAPSDSARLFFGHPYRRWASFLARSTIQELAGSPARFFIAQGGRDAAVTRESFDLLGSHLLAAGRPVTIRLVPEGDHSFARPAAGTDGWAAVLAEIVAWFLDRD